MGVIRKLKGKALADAGATIQALADQLKERCEEFEFDYLICVRPRASLRGGLAEMHIVPAEPDPEHPTDALYQAAMLLSWVIETADADGRRAR